MKWLNRLKRLWATPSKEVAEQKFVEESEADQKETDSIHKHLKKKPPAKSAAKPTPESAKIQAWQTQFEGIAENAPVTQVIIGLDFGTAFTKVVISGAGEKYGVPLNDNKQETDKYLLPTRLYEDSEGKYFVDKPENCVSSHTDLKMQILDGSLDDNTKKLVIYYIAEVLQRSRSWLMSEKQSVFRNSQLKWAVNIGLPTERHTNEVLRKTYRELVEKAWYMSTESLRGQEGNGKLSQTERKLHPDLIEAFPEFVAQIQGYIESPQRQPGIHTLVDVGAGTIDATVFIVHQKKGEDRHPILAESVERFGTTYLAEHRCEELENNGWRPSPYAPFPSLEDFSQKLRVSQEEIESKDMAFHVKVINDQIHPILKQAKDNHDHGHNIVKDTSANRKEGNGIPLMLCGGGARVEFYKKVVSILIEPGHGYLLHEGHLPMLDKLDAPDLLEADSDRLSVAYGLSFDALNIGEISRPEPILPEAPRTGKCPLCNGTGGYGYCARCGGRGFL